MKIFIGKITQKVEEKRKNKFVKKQIVRKMLYQRRKPVEQQQILLGQLHWNLLHSHACVYVSVDYVCDCMLFCFFVLYWKRTARIYG